MKNPMMARLLGESDDVVPVIAHVPQHVRRDRLTNARRMERKGEKDDDDDSSVARMVGEAQKREEEIIPDDAEPVSKHEMTVGKPLREPKEIVQEPSHPPGDKEKYQTPYAALTAPDVTPMSTQPIDPSEVPGNTKPEKFTAAQLERAVPVDGENSGLGGEDTAVKAMDVLLGRQRTGKPARTMGEFDQAGATTTTEEQAAAMLGIKTPLQEQAAAKAANMLVPGGAAMPAPAAPTDGSAVYSAFRRFTG